MAALEHRRNPPVLGYFREGEALDGIHFQPTTDAPNRVPQGRFPSPTGDGDRGTLLGCRHGLVLIFHSSKDDQVLVWDPVTGDQHRVATPTGFDVQETPFDGAVLRAAGGHFQVVLVGYKQKRNPRAAVCIYSSETGVWSNLLSTPVPRDAAGYQAMPAVLVEDSLYWLCSSVILKVDLRVQSLAVIQVPADMFAEEKYLMRAEGGGLGLFSLSGYTARLWKMNANADGVSSWVLGRTVELGRLLSLDSKRETSYIQMIGYAEENGVAFLRTVAGIFMVQLETLEFKKLLENNNCVVCYPLESVYAAETSTGGGHDALDSTASPMSAQAGEMTALEYRHNPPVLGFFREALDGINFQPTMEAPNCVPHGRFSSPIGDGDSGTLLGCRHGLVLIFDSSRDQVLVWDPVTGHQRRIATPAGFDVQQTPFDGAVLRAAGGHFQVVLVGYKKRNPRAVVCIYSSETGVWSNLLSTTVPRNAVRYQAMPAVLVEDSLYWLCSSVILKVDLCRKSLAVIQVPADMFAGDKYLMRAEDGGLGLFSLSEYTAQLWKRNAHADGVSSWVLGRTIELGRLLSLDSKRETSYIQMIGYAEENNVAFLRTVAGIFMVQLETLQFKKLPENNNCVVCYPLESVYAAETSTGGGHDALESTASPMSAQAGEMTALEYRHNPPVLGFFRETLDGINFQPTMEAPNRVPHGRFSSPISNGDSGTLLGCRHGLVLIFHSSRDQILVWDPVTGDQHRAAAPPRFDVHQTPFDGAVLRAAGDHFRVVLVGYKQKKNPQAIVCFFSSETGVWSNLIETPIPRDAAGYQGMPAVLVGDSLYWLCSSVILKVDLREQNLAVIQVPVDMSAKDKYLMRAEGGGLGLFSLSEYTAQLWKKRNTDAGGVSSWVLGRTIELGRLLSLDSKSETRCIQMIGYAEENNVAFLRTVAGIFMVQLETLQFKKLLENNNCVVCYPLESVYAAETSTGGGHDALDSTASPMSAQAGKMTALEYRHNPPVLGFFREAVDGICFQSTMEAPNHVPHGRFSSPIGNGDSGTLLGCRHGLVLIFHSSRDQFLVWDPVTGDQRRIATPPGFDVHQTPFDGAVLRAAGGHFQVVLVGYKKKRNPRATVCIYSSETGEWSNLIETRVPRDAVRYQAMPAVMVEDSLYWLCSSVILKVNLCGQSLAVIQVPADMFAKDKYLMRAEGGGLGLFSLSEYTAQLWKRNADANGVSSWVLGRTIELGRLLSLDSNRETRSIQMIGYAEENNVAFLRTVAGIFMVQLETLQFKKLLENNNSVVCYPIESVYAAETSIGGGPDALDSAASPMSMTAPAGEMTALEHRRNPPVLGYFREAIDGIHFQPTMEGPNRVPHGRFSSPIGDGDNSTLLGCRHGLVLIFHSSRDQILVWDPVTGEQTALPLP
ncbi:uncharacterized protein LOC124689383 [Lolium rigidum]|uniref:uncharacterized protein LOC124689383 n=1 Tax=Lolium rigidum TaxID=89674 RepID=UPI001F5D661E|nr:uncharacterized protein LOC124689383 [Lolium rigidum]